MKKENKCNSQNSAELTALLEYSRFTKKVLAKPANEVFDHLLTSIIWKLFTMILLIKRRRVLIKVSIDS
ncbi:hypothetical protein [Citrobacter portucalensis]|uniref:hypothetical protein n=1 Tax=Citrobacter portucalensis TaxID=1639133 RepID=UPI00388D7B9F